MPKAVLSHRVVSWKYVDVMDVIYINAPKTLCKLASSLYKIS